MGIKELMSKLTRRREKYKEMDEDYRLQKKLIDRQKSSNERELEGYMKRQREENIKQQLEQFHNKDRDELWHGSSIFKGDKSILTNDKPILKEKNIFKGNKYLFGGKGCFLK